MNAIAVINLLMQLAQVGTALMAQMQQAAALVRKLQEENRDATPEEWAALDAAFQASKGSLEQAIKDRQNAEALG